MLGVHILVGVIFGIVAAVVADRKGRNVVGWFFGGLLLGLIGLVIVACLPNLRRQREYLQRTERERHRLREQLRQERMKTEAFRQYSTGRLDAHDDALGMDTRSQPALTAGEPEGGYLPAQDAPAEAPPATPEAALDRLAQARGAEAADAASPEADAQWYYEASGQPRGPVSERGLRALMRAGEVTGTSLLWTAGMSEWTPANQVPRFRFEVSS